MVKEFECKNIVKIPCFIIKKASQMFYITEILSI